MYFSTPSLKIINWYSLRDPNQSSLKKPRQESCLIWVILLVTLTWVVILPTLTSLLDLAPSDSTVSINHIFLPTTKTFLKFKKNVIGLWKNFQESSKIFWAEAAARESVLSSHCWAGRNPHLRGWVPVASWVWMFYSHLISVYLKNHVWLENGQHSNSEEGPLTVSRWMCLWDKVTKRHLEGQHPLGKDVWLCTLEEAISLYSCSLGTLHCNVYFSFSF